MARKQYESSERVSWSCTAGGSERLDWRGSCLFLATLKETSDGSSSSVGLFQINHLLRQRWKSSHTACLAETMCPSMPHQYTTNTARQPLLDAQTHRRPSLRTSARKHFTQNRVEKSFWSAFLLFFSKRSVKQGAAYQKTDQTENCQEPEINITWAGFSKFYNTVIKIFSIDKSINKQINK